MVPERRVTGQAIPRIGGRLKAWEYYAALTGVKGKVQGMLNNAHLRRESKAEALARVLSHICDQEARLLAGEGFTDGA